MRLLRCAPTTIRFVAGREVQGPFGKSDFVYLSHLMTREDSHGDATGGRLSARKVDRPALVASTIIRSPGSRWRERRGDQS
jgi:hypothetical protein